MKHIIINILILLLVSIQFTAWSQDSLKLQTISKKVGEVIDLKEKKEFGLFDEISDDFYKEARFYEKPDKSKILIIYLNDGSKQISTLSFTEYFNYKTQIDKKPIQYELIDTSIMYIVNLIDESSITGKIIKINEKDISIKTRYIGTVIVPKKDIGKIIGISPNKKPYNEYWIPNPHDSRHLFAPTGRNLPKGEGYFHDIYLLLISANYGLTDYLTIGGGMSIVPGIGLNQQAYFLNPKIGFDLNNKFSLGAGMLYVNYPLSDEYAVPFPVTAQITGTFPPKDTIIMDSSYSKNLYRKNGGILFGVGTYGTRENNVSLGVGYSMFNNELLKTPVFMIGGMLRTSRNTALVTENWIITLPKKYLSSDLNPGNYTSAIISYGIRFFGEKMCVDLAFFQIAGEMGFDDFIFPGLPYIDFVLKF